MIQIFDAHCQKCGLGDWVSISEAELAVLIDGGKMLTSCINSDGEMGFLNWIEALKKETSNNKGVIKTQSGERLLRVME